MLYNVAEYKGLFTNYVSGQRGGGVKQMLTMADKEGGGVSEMLTLADKRGQGFWLLMRSLKKLLKKIV